MKVNNYCYCCDSVSSFYKNKNTGKIAKYCSPCNNKYTSEQKRQKEYLTVLKKLRNIK